MKTHTLILGGGMAAERLVKQLSHANYAFPVTVVCNEQFAGYNRVLLPDILRAEQDEKALLNGTALQNPDSCQIELSVLTKTQAISIDSTTNEVSLNNGQTLSYERLIFATGATANRPDIAGISLNGVTALRTLTGAKKLKANCLKGQTAIVVGGGLLGIEAAHALLDLGLEVHLIHRGKHLMNRQLDAEAADILEQELKSRGMKVSVNRPPKQLHGESSVSYLELDNGTVIPAQHVLFAVGITANTKLAQQAGVRCHHGIIADHTMRTNLRSIYAIGECCTVNGSATNLVETVYAQVDCLAATLIGQPKSYVAPELNTRLKIPNFDLFSTGNLCQEDGAERNLIVRDISTGIYRRLVFTGQCLKAAVLIGNTSGALAITTMLKTQIPLAEQRHRLVTGTQL